MRKLATACTGATITAPAAAAAAAADAAAVAAAAVVVVFVVVVDTHAVESQQRQRGTHQAWFCYPAVSERQKTSKCLSAAKAQNH